MNNFKFFSTTLFLFFTVSIYSQFSAGIKLDVVSNNVSLSTGTINLQDELQAATGVKTGATIAYHFSDKYSITSGLTYNMLGFQIAQQTSFDVFGMNVPIGATSDTRVNYLEIPMLGAYEFDLGTLKAFVEAGPSLNYMLNGRIRTIANSLLDFNVLDRNIDLTANNFNRINITGNIGLGLTHHLTNDVFVSGGIKYSRDISSSVEIPIVDARVRNQNIGIGIKLAKKF